MLPATNISAMRVKMGSSQIPQNPSKSMTTKAQIPPGRETKRAPPIPTGQDRDRAIKIIVKIINDYQDSVDTNFLSPSS